LEEPCAGAVAIFQQTRPRGGRRAWKAFHDRFPSYNGPPVPLVRARMMGGRTARAAF